MTYAELLAELLALTPEQLKQDVTVYLSDLDETYPAIFALNTDEDMGAALDTLDIGHPIISA